MIGPLWTVLAANNHQEGKKIVNMKTLKRGGHLSRTLVISLLFGTVNCNSVLRKSENAGREEKSNNTGRWPRWSLPVFI